MANDAAASSGRVRWGVIGAGGIALRRTIPEGIVPSRNGTLVAVQDTRGVDEIAARFGVIATHTLDELLAQPIDAVYIATPVHLHADQVCAALRAGKHVLCEKPLGLTVAEAGAMHEAARHAKRQLRTGLMMRHHAQHRLAKRMIAAGDLGKPVFARAQLSCWYPPISGSWRQDPKLGGGGALVDLGCHCIDLLAYLFGPIASVSCRLGHTVHAYPVEDSAVVSLTFTNGALGTVDCLFNVPDESSQNRLELYGSEGSLLASGTIGQSPAGTMVHLPRAGSGAYDAQQSRSDGSAIALTPEPVNMYRAQIESFGDAVLAGRSDVDPGLALQTLIEACYESARTGNTITVTSA
jgi:predicted dehydrogenase